MFSATPAASAPDRDFSSPLFRSFFLGGFECSTHRRHDGRRLDLVESTGHDRWYREDYRRLRALGIAACREGLRWHRVERRPGRYDWSQVVPMVRAAADEGIQVVWDILHFGWPDGLDIFRPEFVIRLREFAAAFADLLREEGGDEPPTIAPVNEPSFLSWGGGDTAYINPFARDRGKELKVQLVRAALDVMEVMRLSDPRTRFAHVDPMVHIAADPTYPQDAAPCHAYTLARYQAWDMIEGREWPQLGGCREYLDIIGLSFYPKNQWVHRPFRRLHPGDTQYRPFHMLLADVWERYQRPIFVAETGTEGAARVSWLRYVCDEVAIARARGVDVQGICLYPIINHKGWDDDRYCPNGLWDCGDERRPDAAFAREIARQVDRFAAEGIASDVSIPSAR
ncbi:MAG: beta-glucosidase [Verrucomicrobiae bacterium]|nr:beta-glucosidase [Verrucomicrobiae bacterium]